ncbi:MAG: DegT/DnrJ/EryC1/StrS family aminotransferase [Candidatus Bathyarchaeota archaeon]|nr:DegT/DnrJ/EryC1/StrS family aminotransferase [Candidatus Bathyarchaeota archaeon]
MINVTKSDLPNLELYIEYLKKIWSNNWLTNDGELVQLLEKKLEEYLGVQNVVLTSNGTLALQLTLRAMEIKGEVITTPFTFAATTNALVWEGLTPVFADINPETYNIDPKAVEEKIADKTTAILAVHVYGNPCYIEELQTIARRYNLRLIYDAAHAFGVEYAVKPIASFGDASILSFHATKVFNTIEGGAIVARDSAIVDKLKLMRNHGIRSETEVVLPGINAKMNEFQAAMGLCNLESVNKSIASRKALYEHYVERLSGSPVTFQKIVASKYNYSYMPVLFETRTQRDAAYSQLIANGIKPRKYFFPLTVDFNYFKKTGEDLTKKYGLINARQIADRILCLPIYPSLDISTIGKIVSHIYHAF